MSVPSGRRRLTLTGSGRARSHRLHTAHVGGLEREHSHRPGFRTGELHLLGAGSPIPVDHCADVTGLEAMFGDGPGEHHEGMFAHVFIPPLAVARDMAWDRRTGSIAEGQFVPQGARAGLAMSR